MDAFSDLAFFALLNQQGSLAAAAQHMGLTPPAVSRRLAGLEARLGVRLMNRSTRRMSLTPEGEIYLVEGARVQAELQALEQRVAGIQGAPRGLVRLAATLGFGRRRVAPALAAFSQQQPEVEVQLVLTDRAVNLVEQGLDAAIRFGELPDSRLVARRLLTNARVLCAAPDYLARAGTPTKPSELPRHACIVLREHDDTYGTWQLVQGARHASVKVRGPLSTNDGEIATAWALAGRGIVLRSTWEVAPLIAAGHLVQLLPDWQGPNADVHFVYPAAGALPPKTRALLDFLLDWFRAQDRPAP
ncbi:MAG: LysR family transcriptional regulator [Pseudomonadota bacterium]|nr:LysR family transcriptional regulator [Pseudomonadota bacterium]